MRFQRTEDAFVIRTIVTHETVYPYVSDDNAPARDKCKPPVSPDLCYVLAYDEDELLGMWLLVPANSINWEIHTYLLPECGYRRGRIAAKELAEWIFANTGCQRIFTNVPEFNRVAMKFAKAAGMSKFGVNPQSFLKDGVLWDQTLLGISRFQVEMSNQQADNVREVA